MLLALTALRAAIVLGVALLSMRLLARTSAATRRSVLVGAFAIVLVLPIATAVLPTLHLRSEVAPTPAPVSTSIPNELVEAGPFAPTAMPPRLAHPAPSSTIAAPAAGSSFSLLAILLTVWTLGVVAVLARLGLGLARARRLVRLARFVETLDVDGRPVEVRVSAAIETPAVTGLLVPVVLLPCDAEMWTAERRRIVLAHELAHIRNGDFLASVIAQLAVAIHWFNPLAWLAARRLRIERELAADDRVLDHAGVPASSYAEHLLAIATSQPVPAGALAMAEASQVEVRIRALLAPRTRRSLGRSRFVLGAAALALATVVACATPEPETSQPVAAPSSPAAKHADEATTVDPQIQAIVDDEVERLNKDWAPCAAIVLVLDPQTGHVLAAAYRGGTESTAQLAAVRPMVPGSTMKPLVIAAALEEGVIHPSDKFDASPGPLAPLKDAEPHGVLDVREILTVSSNVGLAKIFDRLGGAKLATWGKRFHLASVPSTIPDGPSGAAVAIGAKFSSSPLEIAAAFATLANGGVYHAPTFVPRRDDGERVVRAETATTVLDLLEGVTSDHGTGKAARLDGVKVAGKTGTSHLGEGPNDYYASFVGTAPADHPRYVIFVGAETPRDGGSGGKVAAPVFARVMNRLLRR
jgi:beta-lactamase regulating signal transducer with metallopeptidase domain